MSASMPRVLIVEDDLSWQQLLGEILADMGMEVDQASSYEEAVGYLRSQPHRLAILDLSLGGTDHHNQDGLRVADAVRQYDPNCLVLFLTGFATVEFAVKVMRELDAFTCLRKESFRRAEFRKVINEALAQASVSTATVAAEGDARGGVKLSPDGVQGEGSEIEPGLAVVVEDDAGWRGLLEELLQDAGFRVRTSSSYVEAISLLKHERYDLAVVDLSLASSVTQENLDGFRLLSNMQKASVPVIVVSGFIEPQRIEHAIEEGLIFACFEKQSFDRKSFRTAVENASSADEENAILQSLTDREREVLALLAHGLTNKEIARELVITPNTVKRHLKSLFAKLEVNTRAAASAKAISMRLTEPE